MDPRFNASVTYTSISDDITIMVNDFKNGVLDFIATDVPLSTAQVAITATKGSILYMPETITGIAFVYNLPISAFTDNIIVAIKLNAELIAKILSGAITTWNDGELTTLNPTLNYNQPIHVHYRNTSSSCNYHLSDFFKQDTDAENVWNNIAPSIEWPHISPTFTPILSTAAMISAIASTIGSFGYTDVRSTLIYDLQTVAVKNNNGAYTLPTPDSLIAAVSDTTIPSDASSTDEWRGLTFVHSSSSDAYPATFFSYLITYQDHSQSSQLRSDTLIGFLHSIVSDGELSTKAGGYVSQINTVRIQNLDSLAHIRTGNNKFVFG